MVLKEQRRATAGRMFCSLCECVGPSPEVIWRWRRTRAFIEAPEVTGDCGIFSSIWSAQRAARRLFYHKDNESDNMLGSSFFASAFIPQLSSVFLQPKSK